MQGRGFLGSGLGVWVSDSGFRADVLGLQWLKVLGSFSLVS